MTEAEQELELELEHGTGLGRVLLLELVQTVAAPVAMIVFLQLQDETSWIRTRLAELLEVTREQLQEGWIRFSVDRLTGGLTTEEEGTS